jgi:hypothetical protein
MRIYITNLTSKCYTFLNHYFTGREWPRTSKTYARHVKHVWRHQLGRRRHLKAKFDPNAPPSTILPRQDYGIDFYGVYNGEIVVIVDLFTRETILIIHLKKRTQENVAQTLLKHIIFQREVPRTLRTDNAPELSSVTGAVSTICEYLKISQIRTGGHNPRGNSICERVNHSIGSMIRKLTDQEYKQLKSIALRLSGSP